MRRIIVLLTVAAAMGAMAVLTASGAVAQEGPPPLEAFCAAHGGQINPPGTGTPTCTYTERTEVPAEHGFTLVTSQVFTITIMDVGSGIGTPVGEPIVSCENPGGKDVPLSNPNPNCTAAA